MEKPRPMCTNPFPPVRPPSLCEPVFLFCAPWQTDTNFKTAAEDEKDRLSILGVSIFLEAFASRPPTLPTTPKKRVSPVSMSVEPATTGSDVCHGNTQVSFLARFFFLVFGDALLGGRGLSTSHLCWWRFHANRIITIKQTKKNQRVKKYYLVLRDPVTPPPP